MRTLYSKYRGKVIDNVDPLKQGRLKVQVAILENNYVWALPCVPFAGKDLGIFFLPPKNTNIWVEFEGGNVEHPIWSGCFWGEKELPAEASSPEIKLMKMPGITIKLDNNGITLELSSPVVTQKVSFKLNADAAELQHGISSFTIGANGGIAMKHNQHSLEITTTSVNINNGALEVI